MPVLTSVSQATRPSGSPAITASSTASEMASAAAAGSRVRHEVDDQRDPLQRVGLAQAVLEVVGPVTVDQLAVVDLNRDPRRPLADLGGVVHAQAAATARGWRRLRSDIGD